MARVRISTTVDPDLLEQARALEAGLPDAVVIESALRALLASHLRAEIDQTYLRAYADHPMDEADEWGDLASFGRAVRAR